MIDRDRARGQLPVARPDRRLIAIRRITARKFDDCGRTEEDSSMVGRLVLGAALPPVEIASWTKWPPPRASGVRSSAEFDMGKPAIIEAMP
jgi:hypothetical protein